MRNSGKPEPDDVDGGRVRGTLGPYVVQVPPCADRRIGVQPEPRSDVVVPARIAPQQVGRYSRDVPYDSTDQEHMWQPTFQPARQLHRTDAGKDSDEGQSRLK